MPTITTEIQKQVMRQLAAKGGASGTGSKKKRSKAHYKRLGKLSHERAKARKEARGQ